jgi:hypothetical protein
MRVRRDGRKRSGVQQYHDARWAPTSQSRCWLLRQKQHLDDRDMHRETTLERFDRFAI